MSFSFLTPWLLGGLVLSVLPWLIHRIRRPEQNLVPFSSLMFVPAVERRVIERRNVQHILLMLMRVALVVLVTIAFARPFGSRGIAPQEDVRRVGDHVILIDISASMRSDGYLERATAAAAGILDDRDRDDRVALITFARHARLLVPLVEPTQEIDRLGAARIALVGIAPTFESTDYARALEGAIDQLRHTEGQPDRDRVIHLVTDLQASGLDTNIRAIVPAGIELRLSNIAAPRRNATLQDAVVTPSHRDLTARVRIKNWNAEPDIAVLLHTAGHEPVEKRVAILPGNATRIDFPLGPIPDRAVTGYFEIEDDDLDADNRRYFAWQPQRKWTVGLLERSGLRTFVEAAIPNDPRLPFRVLPDDDDLATADVILTDDLDADRLGRLERGIPLILFPSRFTVGRLDTSLARIGVRTNGVRHLPIPEQVAWADFDHPIFYPLRAPGYNDFTTLRVSAHLDLSIADADTAARVLSRLESDRIAFLEKRLGDGRLLIWTAGLDPRWSSTIRDPRFVPLIHESLAYLTGTIERQRTRLVGDLPVAPDDQQGWRLDGETDPSGYLEPGIRTWRIGNRTIEDVVNLDPIEGDLSVADEALTHAQLTGAAHVAHDAIAGTIGSEPRHEYGRTLVVFGLLLACAEGTYAAFLNRKGAAT